MSKLQSALNAPTTRRRLLQGACATVLVGFTAQRASANGHLPKLTEDDPTAMALGYVADATKVDVAKWPQRAGDANAEKFCDNCSLYTGKAGDDYGPCSIFPGKEVAAKGWCSAYAPKG